MRRLLRKLRRNERNSKDEFVNERTIIHVKQQVFNESFEYDALPTDHHIRILELAYGNEYDPIVCTLECADLWSPDIRYEALSYAWGDPSDRLSIRCDGKNFSVTSNLYQALHHLRHQTTDSIGRRVGRPRRIWADALCINQNDLGERSRQVLLMGTIYKQTTNQLIWLGADTGRHVVNVFGYFAGFAAKNVNERSKAVSYTYKEQVHFCRSRDRSALSLGTSTASALLQLFACPIFQRGWVIQEVALSPSAEVIWGHGSIDLEWFSASAYDLFTNWRGVFEGHENAFTGLSNFSNMRRILVDQRDPRHAFLNLLDRSRGFKFTDSRDRIYGLLGLRTIEHVMGYNERFVEPDYAFSQLQCYKSVAERYLIDRKDTQILSAVQHDGHMNEHWPSWVPNWTVWTTQDLKRAGRRTCHGRLPALASETILISKHVHCSHESISLCGIWVDSIAFRYTGGGSDYSLLTMLHSQTSISLDEEWTLELYDEKRREEICLAWTATAGLHFDTWQLLERPRDEDYQVAGFRAFIKHHGVRSTLPVAADTENGNTEPRFSPFDQSHAANRFAAQSRPIMRRRCFFQTKKGMLGIGPDILQVRDVVVVIFGCTVPLVLRPVEVGIYRIVGECYVYEIMDGQAVDEWRKSGREADRLIVL